MSYPTQQEINNFIVACSAGTEAYIRDHLYKWGKTGIDDPGSFGANALNVTIAAGDLTLAKRLLDAGADVNKQDNEGQTVLFWAMRLEKGLALIQTLISYGARLDIVMKTGDTILTWAERRSNPETQAFIKELIEEKKVEEAQQRRAAQEGADEKILALKKNYPTKPVFKKRIF